MVLQQNRRLVADRAMGAFFVIVLAPILYLFLGVGKAKEPVGVETFLTEASVERLDECVVGGLAGPGEVQRDAALVGPDVEIARHELGALIDTDRRRESHFIADSFQYLHDIGAAESADSDRCRPGFRDDLAHHSDLKSPTRSEMMSPTIPG